MKILLRTCGSLYFILSISGFALLGAQSIRPIDYWSTIQDGDTIDIQIPKFGEIDSLVLRQQFHPSDSSAEAAVLYDIGFSYFNIDLSIIHKRRTRIKVYKPSGTQYGDVSVPCPISRLGLKTTLILPKGRTYNLENEEIVTSNLDLNEVFREQINSFISLEKFVMPNVRVGSIIEYEYTLVIPFTSWLPNWQFQSTIPVQWSQYQVRIPPNLRYTMIPGGFSSFFMQDAWETSVGLFNYMGAPKGTDKNYLWVKKDVPAFKNEPFITTPEDYVSQISFQLDQVTLPDGKIKSYRSTWEELIKELLKDKEFGGSLRKNVGRTEAVALASPFDKPEDKARVIYKFVQDNFKWDGRYHYFPFQKPKELWKKKAGNGTEINLQLCSMLRSAGLDAKPVLISTRSHGKILLEYPLMDRFNHTIVLVSFGELNYLLDATYPMTPFGLLPPECLNSVGIIFNEEETEWVSLEQRT